MRLSQREIKIIKDKTEKFFGKSKVILFGSRIDNNKKGGDIDLYIIPQQENNLYIKKLRLKSLLEDLLYKPVDIVIQKDKNRFIEQEALSGVELNV